MADDASNELLMQLVDENGKPVLSEAQTELTRDPDPLVGDYGNGTFFALERFSLGMNIGDSDPGAATRRTDAPDVKFGAWKSLSQAELRTLEQENFRFPLHMDEFSVTRRYDRASPMLFQKCAASDSFRSASVVKRKVVGTGRLQTFLRLDFEGVLVTHIGWRESDELSETLCFVFRSVTVQYRPQASAGTLGPAASVTWSFQAGLVSAAKGR